MRLLVICVIALMAVGPTGQALAAYTPEGGIHRTFDLYGPHLRGQGMRIWAHEVQVPLPQVKIWVGYGDPVTYPGPEIYLPKVGEGGWTAEAVRGLFYHELGHVFDHNYMTPALHAEFRREAGVPGSCWRWWYNCKTVDWVVSNTSYTNIPPGEIFAEEYAACALGLTQRGYQDAGYNSYGWVPPEGTNEQALCDLIRRASIER